jgi:hypothetical protein
MIRVVLGFNVHDENYSAGCTESRYLSPSFVTPLVYIDIYLRFSTLQYFILIFSSYCNDCFCITIIMTELLDLCYDVLIRILEEINVEDLAACAQTSSGFNEFIKKNVRLYKVHYLHNFVRDS